MPPAEPFQSVSFAHPFEYRPSIRTVCGAGQLGRLGELAREYGGPAGRRALLVSDAGVARAGISERARQALVEAGWEPVLFAGVGQNPTTADVEAAVQAAQVDGGVDLIVGVGGGSALDCAKGANFVLSNGGPIEQYHGFGKAAQPMLPSIGVPTTAGTGSEAQSYALIARADTHEKMACGDFKARFACVVLDPLLCRSAPQTVRATAGIDALSHAVEALVTRTASPISRLYALEAWRLLDGAFEAVLQEGATDEAWAAMQWGSHLAGLAIEASMLGAAHALANPLTAAYGTVHGAAVGLMLPHVVRFNAEAVGDLYSRLCPGGAAVLAERLEALRHSAGLPGRLQESGVEEDALPELARQAAGQWTGAFNPRPVDEEALLSLYRQAF